MARSAVPGERAMGLVIGPGDKSDSVKPDSWTALFSAPRAIPPIAEIGAPSGPRRGETKGRAVCAIGATTRPISLRMSKKPSVEPSRPPDSVTVSDSVSDRVERVFPVMSLMLASAVSRERMKTGYLTPYFPPETLAEFLSPPP